MENYLNTLQQKQPITSLRRSLKIGLLILLLIWSVIHFGNSLLRVFESDTPSISHGSTGNGSLENGKRLPTSGPNFSSYSRLGALIGRTAVHDKVRDVVIDAYKNLEKSHPELRFIIGETGWVNGGPFPPHKTHQNGLSVDFMTPIRNEAGVVKLLPTSLFHKFGYNIEFDEQGRWYGNTIDYEAIALHLNALARAADHHGIAIERVIFDPVLQPALFATTTGKELRTALRFSTRRSWVRHDEHYHIDFRLE